jgi:hypothetical protein
MIDVKNLSALKKRHFSIRRFKMGTYRVSK